LSVSSILLPADPKANYLAHKDEIDQAIHRVLESGWYILGHEVTAFEQEFAQYIGVQDAVGTASGTDALHLALRACGIRRGDAVITVSHTAVATVAAIELAGAIPVLVDIDPATFTMDPNCLEEAIREYKGRRQLTTQTDLKAIIPVHLYGHPADMPAIMDIASRYNVFVIEDCAQSHGAAIRGRRTGAWGHLSVFSFYPTKNLGAVGDGGAVVTNDPELAEKARLVREYGWRDRYVSYLPGMNTRLDEIQAAILRVKLKYLDEENKFRQRIAEIYNVSLSPTTLILPRSEPYLNHVYHQYVVRSNQRDDLRRFLKANSVDTLIHYPVPVHWQPAYQGRIIISSDGLQQTEQVCREILSLPIHPQMTDEHAQRVSEMAAHWCKQAIGES
jgi:dTDP-4-amino-4,6-dideoxygalactose transaminase